MRLIHTTTLELHEFFDSQIPKYAILSHCWGKDEVTFQQFRAGEARSTEGLHKIFFCCGVAKRLNLEWAWVDTCCIDKTSTAELSEAINSMYKWYRQAEYCFVRLPESLHNEEQQARSGDTGTSTDVDIGRETWLISSNECQSADSDQELHSQGRYSSPGVIKSLKDSRWFTRGWTLQELLASRSVIFWDRDGNLIGHLDHLHRQVSEITGIDVDYLIGSRSVQDASVACRMSWASRRETTRSEDIAYCLLGIFNINIPLLYGEGARGAFRRLQEAIIGQSDDQTIFAWTRESDATLRSSILAQSPADFKDCAFLVPSQHQAPPSRITSRGVEIHMTYELLRDMFGPRLMSSPTMRSYSLVMYLTLACYDSRWATEEQYHHDFVQIKLKRDEVTFTGVEQYYRVETSLQIRSAGPEWAEHLKRWANFVIAPSFWSIYAQRLDTARDDRPQAPRTKDNPYPQWHRSGILTAAWPFLTIFTVHVVSRLGHWLGQINHGTLLAWASVIVALYYQRSQLAHLLFFASSGHTFDKRVWVAFLTSWLLLLDLANPSWLSSLLPAGHLRSWFLVTPQAWTTLWSVIYPSGTDRGPPVVAMVMLLLAQKVIETFGIWLVSRLSRDQAICLNIVMVATVALYWYSRRSSQ